jgi:hypothetical protein
MLGAGWVTDTGCRCGFEAADVIITACEMNQNF